MKVFEDMLKTDSKTGKRKSINVQKSFDDGKVAGVRTEYRHKKVGKNGGWKGRISDYEGNQWTSETRWAGRASKESRSEEKKDRRVESKENERLHNLINFSHPKGMEIRRCFQ